MRKTQMRKMLGRYLPVAFLLLFPSMILWTCGGGGGGDPQSDLAGAWDVIELDTGNNFGWARYNVSVDGSGNISLNNVTDSTGFSWQGPPEDIQTKWVVDGSGTIREYDTSVSPNILSPSLYGSLASNKKLAVATDNGDETFMYSLLVLRKRDASITFSDGDIRGKNFVYHQLYSGTDNVWEYGYGSIDAFGNVSIDNVIGPSGSSPGYPQTNVDIIHVDPAGIVTNLDNTFYGMLTVDKSTLFGLITEPMNPNPKDRLIVIQFLGQTYAQVDLAGTWRWHLLYGSNAPGWAKGSLTTGATGSVTYDKTTFLTNTGNTVPPVDGEVLTLSPEGIITNSLPLPYHGMLSSGKDIYVRTRTTAPTRYSIGISVK
jgi:hypothetical protein